MFRKPKDIKKQYGVSSSTLRSWATQNKIKFIQTPGGGRLYEFKSVRRALGDNKEQNNDINTKYIYARVSSSKQQPDLERQIDELQKAYPGYKLIKDVGSGINFKKQGLRTLLDRVNEGLVSEVVVMHRDRLARFGADLLEFIFSQKGCQLVVHRQGEGPESTQQLADDLLAITTVFVATHHGRRAAENRKRRREQSKEEEKDSKVESQEGVLAPKNKKNPRLSQPGPEKGIK